MEGTKKCTKCGMVKGLPMFRKDKARPDGLRGQCKSCLKKRDKLYNESEAGKARNMKYNKSGAGKYRNYKYSKTESRKLSNKRYEQGEHRKVARREYNKSERGRASDAKYRNSAKGKETRAKYLVENKHKVKARSSVREAVIRGAIPPLSQVPCNDCGEQSHHYHHHSYLPEDWLNVTALCRLCHSRRHATEENEGNKNE